MLTWFWLGLGARQVLKYLKCRVLRRFSTLPLFEHRCLFETHKHSLAGGQCVSFPRRTPRNMERGRRWAPAGLEEAHLEQGLGLHSERRQG